MTKELILITMCLYYILAAPPTIDFRMSAANIRDNCVDERRILDRINSCLTLLVLRYYPSVSMYLGL